MKTILTIVAAALVVAGAAVLCERGRPRVYPPGVLVAAEPVQSGLPTWDVPDAVPPRLYKGEWTLTPLARFVLAARVLSVHDYPGWHDQFAAICPRDVAVGWGLMSDQRVLDRLRISQWDRFYFFEYDLPPPAPKEEIVCHSTNLHLIAADDAVAGRIGRLRGGDLVWLRGALVECDRPGLPRPLRSSLSRTDTGPGACEIVWVEELRELPAPSPGGRRQLATAANAR